MTVSWDFNPKAIKHKQFQLKLAAKNMNRPEIVATQNNNDLNKVF